MGHSSHFRMSLHFRKGSFKYLCADRALFVDWILETNEYKTGTVIANETWEKLEYMEQVRSESFCCSRYIMNPPVSWAVLLCCFWITNDVELTTWWYIMFHPYFCYVGTTSMLHFSHLLCKSMWWTYFWHAQHAFARLYFYVLLQPQRAFARLYLWFLSTQPKLLFEYYVSPLAEVLLSLLLF